MSRHAPSKWIEGLSAEQPVSVAARKVLEARLGAVWDLLPSAAYEAEEDREHVHQLRVGSRRAHAALRAFEAILPPRRARRFVKQLHRVRRAAGDARDCDVQLARLEALAEGDGTPAVKAVLARVTRQREKAQEPIIRIYERLEAKDFPRQVKKLLKRLDDRRLMAAEPTFGEHAAEQLREVSARFFDSAVTSDAGFEELHQFRIRAKELRYTLEIFAPVWEPVVRDEIYPIVEDLQQFLGEIIDGYVAIDRYRQWQRKSHCDGSRCAWRSFIAGERSHLTERLAAFQAYWTPQQSDALYAQLARLYDENAAIYDSPALQYALPDSPPFQGGVRGG